MENVIFKQLQLYSDFAKEYIQWNPYKAGTIRSKKKCPLYGDVRFIECFPKTQLFSKI